jgi:hypothetical protein
MEKSKSLSRAGNRTLAGQPVDIPTEVSQHILGLQIYVTYNNSAGSVKEAVLFFVGCSTELLLFVADGQVAYP